MRNPVPRLRATLAAALTLSACAPTLPFTKTDSLPLPSAYPTADGTATAADPSTASAPWKVFVEDPHLVTLVEAALKHNQELKIAEQEINIANNEVSARRAEYWPKLDLKAGYGLEQAERFSTEDANGRTVVGKLGVAASWEVDVWGRLRKAGRAAYYRYLSSVEGRKFQTTGLVGEVAHAYFELLALDNQLAVVESYLGLLAKISGMVGAQRDAGRVTSLAVKRFEAEVLKNDAQRYELRQRITVTENHLNALMGRFPQPIAREHRKFTSYAFTKVQASVPVRLLDNRPDVKKASFALEAAKLDVASARARFYPALSIEGGVGFERFNSDHFVKPPTSLFYDLIAGVTAPLLNRRGIKADYFTANSKQIQAVYEYEQTLIKAYVDVANQLTALKNLDAMYGLKSKQMTALNDAVDMSNTLFAAARVDYVEALLTRRDALETEIELIEIKQRQLAASIDLYRALGGGWRN